MASSTGEEGFHFVDRTESTLSSPVPSQINNKKIVIREGSSVDAIAVSRRTEVHTVTTRVRQTVSSFTSHSSEVTQMAEVNHSSEHSQNSQVSQRSEVNVEVDGFKETAFLSSDKIVTDRVRTVLDRSQSGSTSSTEADHREIAGGYQYMGEDSAFGDSAFLDRDNNQRERTPSDSYYISQTYQIDTPDSPTRSVTALNSVKFRSSKNVRVGAHGQSVTDEDLHFVDRSEEIIPGDSPYLLGSPQGKYPKMAWPGVDEENIRALEKMKSAREDVQQLIESTYMVSDIADVIDDNKLSQDSSLPEEPSATVTTELEAVTTTVQGDQAATSASARPGDLPELLLPDPETRDNESPPRLDYSPGMAIRNYALEELAEKKTKPTSDERVQEAAKSLRFDEESSTVDVDGGSSVDAQTNLGASPVPHLRKVDFTQAMKSRQTEHTLRTSTTQDIHMFKLTKVHKVSLPDDHYDVETSSDRVGETTETRYPVQEVTKEEEDESLDKLVDLESIQFGYRFHDTGMMQEPGGICNLAFDDTDEMELQQVEDEEVRTSQLRAQQQATSTLTATEGLARQERGLSVKQAPGYTQDTTSLYMSAENAAQIRSSTEESMYMKGASEQIGYMYLTEEHTVSHLQQDAAGSHSEDMQRSLPESKISSQEFTTSPWTGTVTVKEKHELRQFDQTDSREDVVGSSNREITTAQTTGQGENTMVFGEGASMMYHEPETLSKTDMENNNDIREEFQAYATDVNQDIASEYSAMSTEQNRGQLPPSSDYTERLQRYSENTVGLKQSDQLAFINQNENKNQILSDVRSESSTLQGVNRDQERQTERLGDETERTENLTQTVNDVTTESWQVDMRSTTMKDTTQSIEAMKVDSLSSTMSESKRMEMVQNETLKGTEKVQASGALKKEVETQGTIVRGPPVNVTRRFNISKKFESTLKSQGAMLKSETMTIDVYYDTPDFVLTLSDAWLRSHNGKWQFHCNFTKLLNDATKTEYSEIEDNDQILTLLSRLLGRPIPRSSDLSLSSFVLKAGLREFVRYTTTRKTYIVKGLTVELELPEYGAWVGSVTSTAPDKAQIHQAVSGIDAFWKTTGVEALNLLVAL